MLLEHLLTLAPKAVRSTSNSISSLAFYEYVISSWKHNLKVRGLGELLFLAG